MKKIILATTLLAFLAGSQVQKAEAHGFPVAAGVFGGLVAGTVIAESIAPRPYYYAPPPAYYYPPAPAYSYAPPAPAYYPPGPVYAPAPAVVIAPPVVGFGFGWGRPYYRGYGYGYAHYGYGHRGRW